MKGFNSSIFSSIILALIWGIILSNLKRSWEYLIISISYYYSSEFYICNTN